MPMHLWNPLKSFEQVQKVISTRHLSKTRAKRTIWYSLVHWSMVNTWSFILLNRATTLTHPCIFMDFPHRNRSSSVFGVPPWRAETRPARVVRAAVKVAPSTWEPWRRRWENMGKSPARWCPPVTSWVIIPMKTIVTIDITPSSTLNIAWYGSYKPT